MLQFQPLLVVCTAVLLGAVLGEGNHEAGASLNERMDLFRDFQVPVVDWELERSPDTGIQPIAQDRTGLLQLFLLNQAVNTRHPPPEEPEAEEHKIVRCFRVPKMQRCTRTHDGPWDKCEIFYARECYLYTYPIQSQQ